MRLLIATGGSPHSEAALRLGAHILSNQPGGEPPTIITVIKEEKDSVRAGQILKRAGDILPGEVRTLIRVGRPAVEIIREARSGHYDLVIVGERANHRLMTRFLGSTATSVIAQAPCPVIIAKGQIGPLRHILLCDSGGGRPSVLSRFTAQLAALLDRESRVTVLHVMSQISAGPGVPGRQLRASAAELIQEDTPEGALLRQDIQTLDRLGVRSIPKVRHGLVVEEILAEARTGHYDLVVIGDYQGAGWGRLLLDNLARQIIVKIDRPVLVVR